MGGETYLQILEVGRVHREEIEVFDCAAGSLEVHEVPQVSDRGDVADVVFADVEVLKVDVRFQKVA